MSAAIAMSALSMGAVLQIAVGSVVRSRVSRRKAAQLGVRQL